MDFLNSFLTVVSIVVTILGVLVGLVGLPAYRKWIAGRAGAISIGIIQKKRNVLLLRRVRSAGRLTWGFPTGRIKEEESELPEDRVVKETLKETGVHCQVKQKIGERIHPDTGHKCFYFHCIYLHGRAVNVDPTENAEVKWVPADKVSEYVTSDIYIEVRRLLDRIAGDDSNGPNGQGIKQKKEKAYVEK